MGKGSARRPGEGYEDGWARIFGKKDETAKNAELRAMLDAMKLAKPVKCTEPFCQCDPGKCKEKALQAIVDISQEWGLYDAEDDGK